VVSDLLGTSARRRLRLLSTIQLRIAGRQKILTPKYASLSISTPGHLALVRAKPLLVDERRSINECGVHEESWSVSARGSTERWSMKLLDSFW
jgi:hypothetical protein